MGIVRVHFASLALRGLRFHPSYFAYCYLFYMSLSYNVRFRKMNLTGRVLLEKEGEIILMDKGFRMRGKGAQDRGEILYFSDVKDISVNGDVISIATFTKDTFEVCHAGSLIHQLVKDIYSVRNTFLIEALFLKQGKWIQDFDVYFERSNAEGRDLGKGRATLKLYEESVVIIPQEHDAFALSFHFMQMQDFDDDEYTFKVNMEHGTIIHFSQFGNGFDEFQEQFYREMSRMYQEVIHELEYLFIDFHKEKLVKLSHLMRRGKAVRIKDIAKIDKDLATKVVECVFKDEAYAETAAPLRSRVDDDHLFIGLSVSDGKKEIYRFIVIFAASADNIMACTLGSYEKDIRKVQDTYFFRIIMEQGAPEDYVTQKVLEMNQACLLLHFIPDPIYKDKRELKNTIYKFAIRKLGFLRTLRGSFLARCPSILPELFARNFERVLAKAKVAQKELPSVE